MNELPQLVASHLDFPFTRCGVCEASRKGFLKVYCITPKGTLAIDLEAAKIDLYGGEVVAANIAEEFNNLYKKCK